MRRIILACAVAGSFGVSAKAAELPKEGPYDISNCSVGTGLYSVEFSKTNSAYSYEFVGTSRSNPLGGMFDLTSFRCVGLTTTINGKQSATGVCEIIDKSGDKILSQYAPADVQGRANESAIAGTGKYDGIIMSATAEVTQAPLAKPGSFQICVHSTGTYKLK
jgi:hypothetical protein